MGADCKVAITAGSYPVDAAPAGTDTCSIVAKGTDDFTVTTLMTAAGNTKTFVNGKESP
jgi:hypothetical protein